MHIYTKRCNYVEFLTVNGNIMLLLSKSPVSKLIYGCNTVRIKLKNSNWNYFVFVSFNAIQNHRTAYDIAMAKENLALAESLTKQVSQEDAAAELKKHKVEHYGVGIFRDFSVIFLELLISSHYPCSLKPYRNRVFADMLLNTPPASISNIKRPE